jgi:hypothetical protein
MCGPVASRPVALHRAQRLGTVRPPSRPRVRPRRQDGSLILGGLEVTEQEKCENMSKLCILLVSCAWLTLEYSGVEVDVFPPDEGLDIPSYR